jgi:Transglycosylase SLT domain
MQRVLLSLIFALMLSLQARAAVQPQTERRAYTAEVCGLLSHHAGRNNLPVEFFARLIWKESIFDAQAVSPAGTEGIAQFLPGTAKLRGLKNSFDHREALSAAAYNFGEESTRAWLANRRALPAETEDYLLAITGHAAMQWCDPKAELEMPGLGGGFSEAQTLTSFERVKSRYATLLKDELPIVVRTRNLSRGRKLLVRVMIGRNSRQKAEGSCAALRAQNGACLVDKN